MAFILRIAKEVHDALEFMTDEQRREVLHAIRLLQADPGIDGRFKTAVPAAPPSSGFQTFYGSLSVWVSYRQLNNEELEIASCGTYSTDPDRPNLRL